MRLDPDHELSLAAVDALDGLLREEPAPPRAPDESLLGFLAGTLAEEDRERLTRLALGSAAIRRRLVELHRASESLSLLPVDRWDVASRAALYLEPARESLRAARDVSAGQWGFLAGSRDRRPSAARATLEEIARNVRLALSAPRFAPARGESADASPSLLVDVTTDGTLVATSTPDDPSSGGRSATLGLIDPLGGSFPIAEGTLRAGRWAFQAEGFGEATGFPPGTLPSSLFRVELDADAPRTRDPGVLWVESHEGGRLVVELLRPPSIAGGVLTLAVRLPQAAREIHGRGSLVVSILLERRSAILGAWPVSTMQDSSVLRAQVFDLPEGEIPFGSMLRARFAEREGA